MITPVNIRYFYDVSHILMGMEEMTRRYLPVDFIQSLLLFFHNVCKCHYILVKEMAFTEDLS